MVERTLRSSTELFAQKYSTTLDDETASTPSDTDTTADEPSLGEVIAAIKKLRNWLAPGSDGIPAVLLKCGIGPFTLPFHCVWRTVGRISSDWRDAIIVTLYKGKGPKSDCSRY